MTTRWKGEGLVVLLLAVGLCGAVSPGRDLVVTEIAFDDVEFVEVWNRSEAALDLHGYTVFDGIDAFLTGVLQPGEYAVMVESENAFRNRYGNGARILAEYDRKLDNDEETLGIRDGAGVQVLRFTYSNIAPDWPRDLPDGHPLELVFPHDPLTDLSAPTSWRRALSNRGSPGLGTDHDRDGLDDLWELQRLRSLDWTAADDPDGDTLDNGTERWLLTDPNAPDSDRDGIADNHETLTGLYLSPENTGTDPISRDSDSDGLADGDEVPRGELADGQHATDPNLADTDGDGFKDGDEVLYLGDPLDAAIVPTAPRIASFRCDPVQPRAGESFTLSWEIIGSEDRELSSLGEGASTIWPWETAREILPVRHKPLIHAESVWKYDHSTTDFGTRWRDPGFDAAGWPRSLAPFGTFIVHFVPGLPWWTLLDAYPEMVATYFRQEFMLPDRIPGNRLRVVWQVDNGGALFLDGQLAREVRMPDAYDRSTSATDAFFPGMTDAFAPEPLGPGPLTVAAEAHAGPGELYGMYFDFALQCVVPAVGVQTYTLRATNPFGAAERKLEVRILDALPPGETFAEWAEATIPADGPHGVKAREGGRDLDGDGIPNLLEFLTAGDPFIADPHPIEIEVIRADGLPGAGAVEAIEVRFARHRNPMNAGVRLEISSDGIDWEALSPLFDASRPRQPSIRTLDDRREILSYRLPFSSVQGPQLFRLRAVDIDR